MFQSKKKSSLKMPLINNRNNLNHSGAKISLSREDSKLRNHHDIKQARITSFHQHDKKTFKNPFEYDREVNKQ